MIEFLVIAWVAWQFTNLLVQDGVHAVKGTTPPRHVERMARLERGEQLPQRYGIGGYLRDLLDDALHADIERRRRKGERKREAEERGDVPTPHTPGTPASNGEPETRPVRTSVPDPDGGPAPAAPAAAAPDQNPMPDSPDDDTVTPASVVDEPATTPAYPPQPQADDGPTARVYQFPQQPEGDSMATTTDNPSGVTEVTGLASAVAYANGVAAAHEAHGSGESYVASLRQFQVGDSDVALVQAAQEASKNAAAKWQTAADALRDHNAGVREAYQTAPEAGNKQFATSE